MADAFEEDSAGSQKIDMPIFVGQGLADKLVVPTTTEDYVKLLCSQGAAEVDTGHRPNATC